MVSLTATFYFNEWSEDFAASATKLAMAFLAMSEEWKRNHPDSVLLVNALWET
jgi:hypothetical protein